MKRRTFVATCSLGCLALGLAGCRERHLSPRHYGRLRLLDAEGAPLRAAALERGVSYVFDYPYVSTPAFLFRLAGPVQPQAPVADREARSYEPPRGVGADGSVVGFCAICVHKLSHPSEALSYISLRERLPDESGDAPHYVSCCAQGSRFDPYDGARVVEGPADQPLAAILLEHEPSSDGLTAVGTLGGEVFNRYFETFARRLQLQHEAEGGPEVLAEGEGRVRRLEDFCSNIVRC